MNESVTDVLNFDNDDISNASSDDVPINSKEVIAMMESAWLNEKFSPEILPHKTVLVDCLLGQINYMLENLENLCNFDFQKCMHQMELDRLRYVVTSYLRIRLKKIETYVDSILLEEEQRLEKNESLYLAPNELHFAKDFQKNVHEHFASLLKFLPDRAQNSWKNHFVLPNMHTFVFAKSQVQVEGVLIDDCTDEEGLVDFRNGSRMIISYQSVADLVKDDKICLV